VRNRLILDTINLPSVFCHLGRSATITFSLALTMVDGSTILVRMQNWGPSICCYSLLIDNDLFVASPTWLVSSHLPPIFVPLNFGRYIEGDYSLTGSYFWMTLINCTSQTYALYSLFMFYHVWNGEFKGIRFPLRHLPS
jgi:hypothetical protein